jgi:inosine-uridine nucleoside N-ribohydrolase
MAGAAFPLVRTKEWTLLWEKMYGTVTYLGAFSQRPNSHGPFEVPTLREGNPTTKAASEDAAHFLVRTVRAHPHEVTIYAGGPMTNLAMALTLDPQFAELSKGLVFMGSSINPRSDNPEVAHRAARPLAEHSSDNCGRLHRNAAYPGNVRPDFKSPNTRCAVHREV